MLSRRSHSSGFRGGSRAFAVLGGFPRAVYRAAKKNAAMAREQVHGAGQVHTKDHLAQRVGEGADQLTSTRSRRLASGSRRTRCEPRSSDFPTRSNAKCCA